ncbi:hypothetical protein [Cardiobacterium hominis]|uniref:hypothetical protein n=1 Tax=Cardiobacterium hominis TaxID=2718 RepID=UPI00288BA333|nr:hypothetical protein [Cardiobacterium hominis]
MMTPEQKAAIAAQLGADLSKLDNDQLIELCVLYRAQPSAHDTFPDALAREITRRFTPAVIKLEGVFYGVLQHFANQFQSPITRFHAALLEMAGTVNRDIWFTDHEALFRAAIDNEEVATWLVAKAQQDILNKCLRNRLALGYLAQSQTSATAILGNETACALWKDAPDLWQVWPQHTTGMTVVAKSAELTQYIIDTPAALAAVVASDNAMQPLIASATARRVWVDSEVAMTAVAASQTAMTAVAASQTAMTAVAASQTAMTAVAASQTAMTAVALSSVALAEIVQTATARTALITHNDNLQAVRQQIYDTVKASWKRKVNVNGGSSSSPGVEATITNPIKSPENALVFACLGHYNGHTRGVHQLKHPDGSIAAQNPPGRVHPTSMVAVDGISFGGASIYVASNFGYSYVELWTKE